jgi:hypothetical protein
MFGFISSTIVWGSVWHSIRREKKKIPLAFNIFLNRIYIAITGYFGLISGCLNFFNSKIVDFKNTSAPSNRSTSDFGTF